MEAKCQAITETEDVKKVTLVGTKTEILISLAVSRKDTMFLVGEIYEFSIRPKEKA